MQWEMPPRPPNASNQTPRCFLALPPSKGKWVVEATHSSAASILTVYEVIWIIVQCFGGMQTAQM